MDKREIVSLIIIVAGFALILMVVTILLSKYLKKEASLIVEGEQDIDVLDVMIKQNNKVTTKKKISKIMKNLCFYVFLVILVPILIFAIYQKISGQTIMVGNKTIMVVATGSMSYKHEANAYLLTNDLNNQFNARDIIVLNKVNDASEIKQYDVICFVNDKGVNVIHRVIEILADGKYLTKGDANGYGEEDLYNPCFDDVVGKYADVRIGYIGNIVMFLQSSIGIVTIIALFYCLIMFDKYNDIITKACDTRISILNEMFAQEFNDFDNKEIKSIDCYNYYFDKNKIVGRKKIKDDDSSK